MRRALAIATAVGCSALLAPSVALAQAGFGQDAAFVLALENLGGISHGRLTYDDADQTQHLTQAGTFFGPMSLVIPQFARLGAHYFVAPPVSVGGLLTYSDQDDFGETLFLAFRVGAALPVGSSSALWLRAGGGYYRNEYSSILTSREFRPGVDALFVLHPVDNFGIILGGMFEMSLAGETEVKSPFTGVTNSQDYQRLEFGLTFGVLADF